MVSGRRPLALPAIEARAKCVPRGSGLRLLSAGFLRHCQYLLNSEASEYQGQSFLLDQMCLAASTIHRNNGGGLKGGLVSMKNQ